MSQPFNSPELFCQTECVSYNAVATKFTLVSSKINRKSLLIIVCWGMTNTHTQKVQKFSDVRFLYRSVRSNSLKVTLHKSHRFYCTRDIFKHKVDVEKKNVIYKIL